MSKSVVKAMDFEEHVTFGSSTRRQGGTKPFKRLLILILALGCLTIPVLYLMEPLKYSPIKTLDVEPDFKDSAGVQQFQPSWTWVCENYTCVRKHVPSTIADRQSLETCSMLCGSTLLWPQPTGPTSLSSKTVPVRAEDFTLVIEKSSSTEVTKYLKEAFALMKEDLMKLEQNDAEDYDIFENVEYKKTEVHVSINGDTIPRIRLKTDESYKLKMKTVNDILKVEINARSFCGARHGIETLSQLIWLDSYAGSLLTLQAASIQDEPRFRIRSLMLDTARNYFPVSDILRTLDAMAANKLNTFQWHATDSQSFPLLLKSAPELAKNGAYSPKQVYTPEDVRKIVRRARVRGIRVVIEIDAPAHVGSAWSYGPSLGMNELAFCIGKEPWDVYCGEPPCGQLNPTNPHVYEILEKIYREIIQLTGEDEVFHLGGDEVNENCWSIIAKPARDLWFDFTNKSMLALEKANGGKLPRITILWSSRLTEIPSLDRLDPKKLTIQLWGGSHWLEMQQALNAGFRTIMSHVDAWYLDCGLGSWRDEIQGACAPYRTWEVVYAHRPWRDRPPKWRIEGAAVCLWTEVTGPEVINSRLWPRGAALAERLWSDPTEEVTADVTVRLDAQRTRMVQRGIRAEPVWARWCSQNPKACL